MTQIKPSLKTTIREILYEYDCIPLSHVREDEQGKVYLLMATEETEPGGVCMDYLVTPITEQELDELKSNKLTLGIVYNRRKYVMRENQYTSDIVVFERVFQKDYYPDNVTLYPEKVGP